MLVLPSNYFLGIAVAVIGDNVRSNKAIATKHDYPAIGCASCKFHIAEKVILADHENILSKIDAVMVKLKKPYQRAKLNMLTTFSHVCRNGKMRSSTVKIILRYEIIVEVLQQLDSSGIDLLRLSAAEGRSILKNLGDYIEVGIREKRASGRQITIVDVCGFFDHIIDSFPIASARLNPNRNVVCADLTLSRRWLRCTL